MKCTSERRQIMALVEFLNNNAGATITLLLALVLVALTVLILRKPVAPPEFTVVDSVDTINKLQQAAEHYADVSAVVSMVRQLNELDDVAIEQLKQYPEAVQAAALIHYINCLGAALQAEQSKLEENFRCNRPELAKWNRGRIDELRKLLDEAVAMSKQTNPGLHVV